MMFTTTRRVAGALPRGLLIAAALACCAPRPAVAPTPPVATAPRAADDVNAISPIAPGLYAMRFAGSGAKSTIVELEGALVLIDVPIRDEGGGAELIDSIEGGARVVRSLARRFPDKPLRLVVSSHAHPHSLSAWRAFLERGVVVVTTRANYARLQGMLDGDARARAAGLVRLVDDAPVDVGDRANPIIARRFTRAVYPSVPTEDYLYVELPRYGAVYVGCMFNRWEGPPIAGRELLTSREQDLFKLLTTGRAPPDRLIRLERERDGELLPFGALAHVVETGVAARELADRYRGLAVPALRTDRARLVREAVRDGIPPQIFNGLVYDNVAARRLERALELAVIQVLVAPASANAWDTLGEVCYLRGEPELARGYAQHAARLEPRSAGGEPAWRDERARRIAAWAAAGLTADPGD